ncbi:MAG TPA: zf-HC2 domain-containing protein [Polyangiaceae bacterium]
MTVVGLHPEELFDKLLDGELTPLERERLRSHLEGCEVCRFEHSARADFLAEALALGPSESPPLMPLRAPAPAALPPRRRSRLLVWGLAAAALISASGALAAVVTGKATWHALSTSFTRAAPPARLAVDPSLIRRNAAAAAPPATTSPAAAGAELASPPSPPSAAGASPGRARSTQLARTARAATPEPPAVVAAAAAAAAAADEAASDASAKAPTSAGKLFAEANQARRSGDIGRASGLYHLLQDQFPGSSEAEVSRVTLALLLLDSGDAQSALTGFERYLAGSSRGLEAEALVGRARALGRLGRRDLEASAWQEVQRKYPSSIYGRQAGERLSALGLQ